MITSIRLKAPIQRNAQRCIFTLCRGSFSQNPGCEDGQKHSSEWQQAVGNKYFPQFQDLNERTAISSPCNSVSQSLFNRRFSSATQKKNTGSAKENALSIENKDRLLVIGSGVAGCSAALIAAQTHGIPVTLICAGSQLVDCNSYWAQGGIIYRNYDPAVKDTAESLCQDIHRAGAGLCNDEAVRKLAAEGPDRVREILLDEKNGIFANVPFDKDKDGELLCCLEASHSAPRIIHFADQSGKAITEHITKAAASHPLISICTDSIVTDLLLSDDSKTCVGVDVMNKESRLIHAQVSTRGVVLASGGLGGIYSNTTNPKGFNALGSSVALALRAGALASDLEYVQFHPTALTLPGEAKFLLTEALRGEGAILRDDEGRAFAKDFHEDGELAPRDVVSRGVYNKQKTSPVFLDITHRDAAWIDGRFPSIQEHLKKRGLDLSRDRLPISPASHYTCGGVTVDEHGLTNIKGLYAAGESACTGLHGGNRLASTSLLEGLVWGAAVADHVGQNGQITDIENESEINGSRYLAHNSKVNDSAYLETSRRNSKEAELLLTKLKKTMWEKVGVVRSVSGTAEAMESLHDLKQASIELFEETPNTETTGLRDASYAGEAVARAAHYNRQSKGAHCIEEDEDMLNDVVMAS